MHAELDYDRMKAISPKRPAQLKDAMNANDKMIIESLIHLRPQSFDLPYLRRLPEEIICFVKEHRLVQGIDKHWIKESLKLSWLRRSFR